MITAFGNFTIISSDTTGPTTPGTLTLTTDPSTTTANLSWGASTDAVGVTGYDIYRDGAAHTTSTTTSNNVTFSPTGGDNTFTVRAYDAAGNTSAFTSGLVVYANPNAPVITHTTSTETSISISYPAHVTNGGIDRAEIYVNNSLKKTEISFSDSSTSSVIDQLSAGTSYNIKMRIFNNSDYSVKGAFSSTITASTSPGAPTT
jgi:hypothetical protein